MPQHRHHLEELLESLRTAVGVPALKRPAIELKQECDAEGLSDEDFADLANAIAASKHSKLAARSIRVLIPRRKLGAKDLQKLIAGFSQTDSSLVRSNLSRFFCALWDSDSLAADGKDCLRGGYAVFFHFLQNERSQREISRLMYRLTRKVDVTALRARELSKLLGKVNAAGPSPLMALAELFDSFKEKLIEFPARENGVPGSSGLTQMSRMKLHEKITRVMDYEWVYSLRRHAIEVVEGDSDVDIAARSKFIAERRHTVTRPKILSSILEGRKPEDNVLLSDVFRVSKIGMIDADPKQDVEKDVQLALVAHLSTWDGFAAQDETFEVFSRLSYPRRPDQAIFERSVVFPMLDLFSSGSPVFKFRASRAFARMLSSWAVAEENSGPFVQRICGFLDDAFCAALIFEQDDPLVQLACVEFFVVMGRALVNRSKLFGAGASPLVPPSEHLALRLLLSPSAVGVSTMADAINALFPVYRMENAAGVHTSNAVKLQSARYFQNLAQDYVKALVLRTGFDPFEEFLRVGPKAEERSLLDEIADTGDLLGDELGVTKSFAFLGLWLRWWEERGETPETEPSDERIGAFLIWLKRFAPGIPNLVMTISTKFNKILSATASNEAQEEDEEEVA